MAASTTRAQRIGIWVIAVAMIGGTLAGFLAMILAPKNQQADQARLQAAYQTYQDDQQAYEKNVTKANKKYYPVLKKYASLADAFDKKDVKKLAVKNLKIGTGKTIDDNSLFSVYYIGWNQKGKVFDQSIKGKKLKDPTYVDGLAASSVIDGWKKGLKGMKLGGVRLLTIPSTLAYGDQKRSKDIPANTPLRFIVVPVALTQPEIPQELLDAYTQQQ